MATDNEKRTYPKLPTGNWWDLRARFKQSPPRTVDADYLQSILGLGSAKAAGNLLSPLRSLGLIDENGNLTELANDWRSDEHYGAACKKMLSAVYPERLLNAFPPPDPDQGGVTSWFARNANVGEGAARQMATFYRLVCAADVNGGDAKVRGKSNNVAAKAGAAPRRTAAAKTATSSRDRPQKLLSPPSPVPAASGAVASDPALQVAIQIYIPAGATPDQIDAIFSSMAKHLYRRA